MTGTILVTGATGYIGGRLARRLAERGVPVRCLVRRPENLLGRVPAAVEVVQGDVLEEASVERALQGVSAAYYLV
ncbi:MAG: SDR family NAD(P)-dependent oxidoreductase, partial [Gemmatimonadetes bacterium]|nr:SDR family NAD(P)-dependent oxidoreductase [Gemmatimonadota bacterium]